MARAEDTPYFVPAIAIPGGIPVQQNPTPAGPDLASPISTSLVRYLDADSQPSGSNGLEPPYVGGRGMVTLDGMSGMFIDPTSGTLPQGALTIQYCLYINNLYGHHFNDNNHLVGHGVMADYGVTDWLDVGLFGEIALVPGVDTRWFHNATAIGGPFARVRLIKEQGWIPEISIGGEYFDGTRLGELLLAKREGFIAASKGFDLDPDGFFRSARFHVGYRYISRPQSHGSVAGDREYVYGGAELGLPYSIFMIGEISSNTFVHGINNGNLPWAAGFQWRPTSVLGISIAYLDPEDHQLGLLRGLWFGFGFNFKF
jgi:hypothetical protein